MKIFGFAGWSGSGKTTLLTRLIPALVAMGQKVSTIKHAHHRFDIDRPGKDSYEHRQAGATEVMISSSHRFALMHELRNEAEPSLDALISRMTPVDLLLIEGFKFHPHDKLEIHRPVLGKPLLARDDPHIVAVASDVDIPDLHIPRLDLSDVGGIAHFVMARCGLTAR